MTFWLGWRPLCSAVAGGPLSRTAGWATIPGVNQRAGRGKRIALRDRAKDVAVPDVNNRVSRRAIIEVWDNCGPRSGQSGEAAPE